jgi:hypothetical protein
VGARSERVDDIEGNASERFDPVGFVNEWIRIC